MGIYMGDLLATAARAQTFWNSDAQACTVCLGRDQRSTDALRSWDLRCLTLYRCARKALVKERAACMKIRVLQPVKRRRFCNSDAQVCTDMLEHSPDGSAALVEAPMPGPYTDVLGRIPSACIRVC